MPLDNPKKLMKQKWKWFVLAISIFALIGVWRFSRISGPDENLITAKVFKADFEDLVVTTGELIAENSEDIKAPPGLQQYRLYNIKIQHLVPEGTLVEPGDYVATLDKTEINGKINDLQLELEKMQSQYTQTKLDTTLQLREARDQIQNLEYGVTIREITLEQSAYEPPATIRQAENDLAKARRDLEVAKENYKIRKKQAAAKMVEVGTDLQRKQIQLQKLVDVQKEFVIYAPKEGMVTYKRNSNGSKRKEGSSISPWDPAVATLPDMSDMLSKTYVNEIDIRKISKNQNVRVSLDAFPELVFNAVVEDVANVGEKRKGTDAKVFELIVRLLEVDPLQKPGMTTSNHIITKRLENVLQLPIEAVHTEDTLHYVYKYAGLGIAKQEVVPGPASDIFIVIASGLKEGDQILLTPPEKAQQQPIKSLRTTN
jgi:HlyD family secretion protein